MKNSKSPNPLRDKKRRRNSKLNKTQGSFLLNTPLPKKTSISKKDFHKKQVQTKQWMNIAREKEKLLRK